MLIGVDGNEANVENRVGSNIYAFEVIRGIYKIRNSKFEIRNDKLKFRVYFKEEPLSDLPKETSWWRYQFVKPKKFSTQFGLPLALYLGRPRPDVFFTPGHYLPRWTPCPAVMSILDVAYLHFPDMFRKRDLFQLRKWTARSVKKAKKILTISQFSKDAIIKEYALNPKKVVVTYPGFKMSKTKKTNLKKYGVEGEFILYVGTLQPRKNLEKLIDAFSQLKDKNLKLVIVGKKGWLYKEIFGKVKKLGLEERVIFTGYVTDEELPTFYQKAQCFVLVSLYEGFGLPPLEAMYYGCPVVVSDVSSLPEVVGKAGVLVDPHKTDEITQGIEKAIKNKEELVKKGRQQAKKFSWEKCAKETLAVLEDVAAKR